MRRIFQEETLQRTFRESGVVKIPMLSPEEVAGLMDGVAKLRPDDGFAPVGPEGRYTYHCSFLDSNTDYKRETHNLIKSFFAPHIATHLVGFEILNCNFYVKPPGHGEFVVHQNWPAIADINDTTVTVWCPLGDVVESNGALQFVKGSHKILPHIEGPNSLPYFDGFRQELIDKYLKAEPLSAGETWVFDDGVIHWSARNLSAQPRIAIQILCTPKDTQPVYFFLDETRPERFELIAVDSEFYIVSHPRDLFKRQPQWKSLGFVENRNRLITEIEFAELLRRGPEIRARIYDGQVA